MDKQIREFNYINRKIENGEGEKRTKKLKEIPNGMVQIKHIEDGNNYYIYLKDDFDEHQKKIREKNNKEIECECKRLVRRYGLSKHRKSKIHKKLMGIK